MPQVSCHITRTTTKTHQLIRDNLHLTPIYGGFIDSKGPRYCPSIEDKIVKFADKESHQIFLEPEGINTLKYMFKDFLQVYRKYSIRTFKNLTWIKNVKCCDQHMLSSMTIYLQHSSKHHSKRKKLNIYLARTN